MIKADVLRGKANKAIRLKEEKIADYCENVISKILIENAEDGITCVEIFLNEFKYQYEYFFIIKYLQNNGYIVTEFDSLNKSIIVEF